MANEIDISKYFYDDDTPQPKRKEEKHAPRWPHSELHSSAMHSPPITENGYFLMQYKEFDIYLYKKHFMLRWGKDWYCKLHRYDRIKHPFDGKYSLPEEVQAAILAARTMVMGDFT